MLSLACLLIVGLLAGCDAAPPTVSTNVDASASPPRKLAQSVGSDQQLSLDDRLTCRDAELFEQPPRVQAAWLAHGNVLSCEVVPDSSPHSPAAQAETSIDDGGPPRPAANCTGSGGLRLFGLPVMAVRVAASGEPAQGLQIDLQAALAELAAAASDALGVSLLARQADPQPGHDQSYQATGDEGRVYYVSAAATGPSPDELSQLDAAQDGTPQPASAPVETATFGCLVAKPANRIDDNVATPGGGTEAAINRLAQTSPSLSQPSPLPRL